MPGQVIGYVRVSTVDQNPERQIVAIQAALGAEPDRWFTDHSSGGSTDRPALAAMLTHVREQDLIVVVLHGPPRTVRGGPRPARQRTHRTAASASASSRRG